MAECLVHGGVPWDAFEIVGTRSKTVADEVAALIGSGSLPRVEIAPRWYF